MSITLRTMGKTMSLRTLYSVILHIVHTLYSLTEILSDVLSYFTQMFCYSNKTTDIDQINVAIKKLDKIPNHIVVVLGTETPSYRDLANIVVWCVAAGIPYISFYDHSGFLKRTKSELYQAVVQASLSTSSWNRTLTGNVLPAAAASKKNSVSAPLVHINVLSLSDGRGTLADLTRECVTSNVNSMKIAVDFLDEKLKKHLNHAPDPEMALCCGRVCSTYGVLPWQVRNTEFINIKTHHNVSVDRFLNSLHTYGYCEQRYGK